MQLLSSLYRPITAFPFEKTPFHTETAPCEALKPYIRCFWGTTRPLHFTESAAKRQSLVIPDTCMDIIFEINYTKNTCRGYFCALDENSHRAQREDEASLCATFAIRFYAWSAVLFSEDTLKGSKNQSYDVNAFFQSLRRELEPALFESETLTEKIRIAEGILLKRLAQHRRNENLLNAVHKIILENGNVKMSDLQGYTALSAKRLERIFDENMGISPKSFASLVRYQLMWQEMVSQGAFHALDAAEKYGYYDQAHLLNDFRRRHLMTPKQAMDFAFQR